MNYFSRIDDATHLLFEGHLHRYLENAPECDGVVTHARTRAAKAMLRMVAQDDYQPRVKLPVELEEQFGRVCEGLASPTHALEALVGGEAIGRLNMAEGRTGPRL